MEPGFCGKMGKEPQEFMTIDEAINEVRDLEDLNPLPPPLKLDNEDLERLMAAMRSGHDQCWRRLPTE